MSDFHIVNRYAVILRPRKPFIEWLNESEEDEEMNHYYTRDEMKSDVFLIKEVNNDHEALEELKRIYGSIFEKLLMGWWEDESMWPSKRTWRLFNEWFSFEITEDVYA